MLSAMRFLACSMSAKEITRVAYHTRLFLTGRSCRKYVGSKVPHFTRRLGRLRRLCYVAPAVALAALGMAALAGGIARGDNRASATAILDGLANDAPHKAATA